MQLGMQEAWQIVLPTEKLNNGRKIERFQDLIRATYAITFKLKRSSYSLHFLKQRFSDIC